MKIEHIAMYVNDLEAARDFFLKYLDGTSNDGYHNKNTDFRSYFISFEDEQMAMKLSAGRVLQEMDIMRAVSWLLKEIR